MDSREAATAPRLRGRLPPAAHPPPIWPHVGLHGPHRQNGEREGVMLPHLHLMDPTPKPFYLDKIVLG